MGNDRCRDDIGGSDYVWVSPTRVYSTVLNGIKRGSINVIGKIANWWASAEASNVTLLILVLVLVAYWADLKNQKTVAEERAVEAVRIIGENNEAAIRALERSAESDAELDSFKEYIDESENREYLDTPIPSDILSRM